MVPVFRPPWLDFGGFSETYPSHFFGLIWGEFSETFPSCFLGLILWNFQKPSFHVSLAGFYGIFRNLPITFSLFDF